MSPDPERLLQLFSNLIANALPHGATGSTVKVRGEGRPVDVALVVHNAGVISPERLPTLFDPFNGRQHPSEGLGLGLFISQEIAQAHGGSVRVESSPETGTAFVVHLPRRSSALDSPAP
jgi:signal transduction histidine kinase